MQRERKTFTKTILQSGGEELLGPNTRNTHGLATPTATRPCTTSQDTRRHEPHLKPSHRHYHIRQYTKLSINTHDTHIASTFTTNTRSITAPQDTRRHEHVIPFPPSWTHKPRNINYSKYTHTAQRDLQRPPPTSRPFNTSQDTQTHGDSNAWCPFPRHQHTIQNTHTHNTESLSTPTTNTRPLNTTRHTNNTDI